MILHREQLALKCRSGLGASRDSDTALRLFQSSSWIPTDIGTSLDPETMEKDPFYSLTEIFKFAAASEHQFLNLMKMKIKVVVATETPNYGKIAELQAIRELINEHLETLRDTLKTVKARGGPKWPRAPSETRMQKKADGAVLWSTSSYEELYSRAKTLSDRCKDAILTMTNDAMFRESQRAIQQTEQVAKLTLLAYFFVPLAFTTSFFGMNVKEISSNNLKIWTWFAITIPVLFFSFFVWFWDVKSLWRRAYRRANHLLFPLSASHQ